MWFYATNDCGTCRLNAQRSAGAGINDIISRVRLYLDFGQIEIRAEITSNSKFDVSGTNSGVLKFIKKTRTKPQPLRRPPADHQPVAR